MEKQTNFSLQNEEALKAAKEEKQINATDLLCELKPLLDEYFIGDFNADENAISLSFLNGQKFRITAVEEIQI